MKKIIFYWLPPFLWMVFIFSLSSRQTIAVSDVLTINFIVFKSLHILEYGFLYFLFFRAFRKYSSRQNKRLFIYAAVATLLFAITDELHQTYVPTRQGTFRDIGIDALGIFLSFMYTKNNLVILQKFL